MTLMRRTGELVSAILHKSSTSHTVQVNFFPLHSEHVWLVSFFKLDDPAKYDGAPCGVQLMGRRLEEEKMLSIAQIMAGALRDYK